MSAVPPAVDKLVVESAEPREVPCVYKSAFGEQTASLPWRALSRLNNQTPLPMFAWFGALRCALVGSEPLVAFARSPRPPRSGVLMCASLVATARVRAHAAEHKDCERFADDFLRFVHAFSEPLWRAAVAARPADEV